LFFCLLTLPQDILTKFSIEKRFRSNIQIKNEWLNAVSLRPEVQKRLSTRRAGHLVRNATPVFDMLKITEMDFNRKRGGPQEASVGSDSEDGSSLDGSSYVGDLPYLESGKKVRPSLCQSRPSMRAKGSPSSPAAGGGGGISVTGTRTSMFGSNDRKNKSSKNYLSARNLPQTKLIYGRGSYRKSMRPTTPNSTAGSSTSPNSPDANLSVELHEWLNNVMGSTATATSSIDLASDRPSSRGVGGGISLSSLGSADVHLASFSPQQSLRAGPLSDDDGDEEGVIGFESPHIFHHPRGSDQAPYPSHQWDHHASTSSSTALVAPAAAGTETGSDLLYSTYHTDGGNSSLRYGISGGSWDPKRTKPIRRRPQKENMKLKISKAVARSRAKYSIPDYVPEATRGRNPLIPQQEQRRGNGSGEGGGLDIIELLAESVAETKKKIPLRVPSPEDRASAAAPMGSLITGLSLTNLSSSSPLRPQPSSSLLTLQSHHLPNRPHSASDNQKDQKQDQQFFLTEAMTSQETQEGITKSMISAAASTRHETKYFLDPSSRKEQRPSQGATTSLIPTDRTAPEVFIFSKYHPSTSQFGTLPSLPPASSSFHLSSQSILQPHAGDPFAAYGPWIPKGGMGVMVSDKSDPLLSWEENRDIARYCDNTEIRTVLKRQGVIRNSFEGFSRVGYGQGGGRSGFPQT
jgi:hypothetical protein